MLIHVFIASGRPVGALEEARRQVQTKSVRQGSEIETFFYYYMYLSTVFTTVH